MTAKYKIIWKNFNNKGFSLIELVAVMGIFSVGLLGMAGLVTQNYRAQGVSRNVLTASMLAQEGVELVRNIRDNNWTRGASDDEWKLGGETGMFDIIQDGTYVIDYTGTSSIDDSINNISEDGARLKISAEGFYNLTDGSDSAFSRLINIASHDSDKAVIQCIVAWNERGKPKTYQVDSVLYNWR